MARDTQQRRAILTAFIEANRPLGPQEVLARAKAGAPRLGLATVYRAIRELVEAGQLATVELPGEAARYEPAGKRHHHHFRCRVCNSVFDLDGCPGELGLRLPDGFEVEDHEIFLYGRCAGCARP